MKRSRAWLLTRNLDAQWPIIFERLASCTLHIEEDQTADIYLTFSTSPSIYVAFQSLHATDLCGQVGKKYNSTTLAFHPGELSTAAEYFIGTPYYITDASNHSTLTTDVFIPPSESFTKADFATVYAFSILGCLISLTLYFRTDCADITTVSLYADTSFLFDPALGGDGTMTVTMTYNLCSPKVSMPTELFTINSLWTGCLKGIDGFFDPPYTLTQGNGLSAFSAADQTTARPPYEVSSQSNGLSPFSTTPTLTASAGPTPAPVTPVKTTADPTSAAPASSPSPDPPASTPSDDILAPTPTMPNEPPVQSPTSASDPGGQSPTPEADSLTLSATPANGPPPKSSTDSSVPADPPTDPEVSTPAPSPVVIASQTLAPGSQITHSSTTYSLASNGATLLIAGSQGITTQILATPTTPSPSSFIVVGAQTVFAGSSAIVLSGTTYSLASNGATLLIAGSQGTSTQILATPAPSPSSYVVIGTNTISAGSSAITVSGTTYSLAPSNNVLVVDGTSQYLIGSQTLVPGGAAITVSGTVASLLPGGSSVVIGGSTLGLTALTGSGPITTSEVEYIIGSQTLSAGGVATLSISGSAVQVSLLAGGSSVVIGGTTTMPAGILISEGAKSTEVPVTETSVGGIIASIGGFLTSSSTSQTSPSSTTAGFNGATFTGSGSLAYRKEGFWVAWWGLLFGIGVFGVMWL